jgi:hypothetical protein
MVLMNEETKDNNNNNKKLKKSHFYVYKFNVRVQSDYTRNEVRRLYCYYI